MNYAVWHWVSRMPNTPRSALRCVAAFTEPLHSQCRVHCHGYSPLNSYNRRTNAARLRSC